MFKSIARWIKSLFVGRGGFRCDSCGKWQARIDGKAKVVLVDKVLPRIGSFPEVETRELKLHCKDC